MKRILWLISVTASCALRVTPQQDGPGATGSDQLGDDEPRDAVEGDAGSAGMAEAQVTQDASTEGTPPANPGAGNEDSDNSSNEPSVGSPGLARGPDSGAGAQSQSIAIGEACPEDGQSACVQGNSSETLICDSGTWREGEGCDTDELCVEESGRCTSIDARCVALGEGGLFCLDEELWRCRDGVEEPELVDGAGCLGQLLGLDVAGATLQPPFSSGTYDYQVTFPLATSMVSVTPSAGPYDEIQLSREVIASGETWTSPELAYGVSDLPIEVSSPGSAGNRYSLTVHRGTETAYLKAAEPRLNGGFGKTLALSRDGSILVVGEPSSNSVDFSGTAHVFEFDGADWMLQAELKASDASAGDGFGSQVAISGDGTRIVVGAETAGPDDSRTGAAYVFQRSSTQWTEEARLVSSNPEIADNFGASVAISRDGAVLAVGAWGEDSSGRGIDPPDVDADASNSGAAYVFRRSGSQWTQDAVIKASNPDVDDLFGWSVALSADGARLAVGARWEDSRSRADQDDNSVVDSGAVYVFHNPGGAWEQEGYLKPSGPVESGQMGESLTLSDDGKTLVAGADLADMVGSAYIFALDETQGWGGLGAAVQYRSQHFGASVSLSADGTVLVIGASTDQSGGSGIYEDYPEVANIPSSGAAHLYVLGQVNWRSAALMKASNAGMGDMFGGSVAVSGDGLTIAVGAHQEQSDGSGPDNNALSSGSVYVFQ